MEQQNTVCYLGLDNEVQFPFCYVVDIGAKSNQELMNPGGKKTCVEAAIRSSAALPDHELL